MSGAEHSRAPIAYIHKPLELLREENERLALNLWWREQQERSGLRIRSDFVGCAPGRPDPLNTTERARFKDFQDGLSTRQMAKKHLLCESQVRAVRQSICRKLQITPEQLCPKAKRQDVRKPGPKTSKKLTPMESKAYPYYLRGVRPEEVASELEISVFYAKELRGAICRRLKITLDQLCPPEKRKQHTVQVGSKATAGA